MSKVEEKLYSFEKSTALFAEAAEIIPGGIYGHFSPTLTVPGSFPFYTAKAEGCRYTDIDGNEFICLLYTSGKEVDHPASFEQERGRPCAPGNFAYRFQLFSKQDQHPPSKIFPSSGPAPLKPVSYTHLDVYKRQA